MIKEGRLNIRNKIFKKGAYIIALGHTTTRDTEYIKYKNIRI